MFFVWGIYNLFHNGILGWIFGKYGLTPADTVTAVAIGIAFVLTIAVSYLLGSVNCALVVSKVFYHDDIRNYGSGNAGATNITRSYGAKAGLLTFFGDGLKGVLSIVFACALFGGTNPFLLVTSAYLAAFICILGHIFPCFSHFRGGKGFATTAMCVLALNPMIFAILAVIFFALVAGSHYVSLGSVVSVLFYPVLLASFDNIFSHYGVSVLFSFLIAALVTWAHRGNLKRIYAGNERKFGEGKPKPEPIEPVSEADEDDEIAQSNEIENEEEEEEEEENEEN